MSHAPETVLRGHAGDAQCLDFAEQDNILLSGDSFGSVRVWNLDSARSQATQAHDEDAGVTQVCVASDAVITQGRDGRVLQWQMGEDGRLLAAHEVLPAGCYHFCKCAAPRAGQGGINSTLGHRIVAVAGDDNKGVRVVDRRSSEDCFAARGSDQCGMTMCIELLDTQQPLLLVGGEGGHVDCWDVRKAKQAVATLRCGEEPILSTSAQRLCVPQTRATSSEQVAADPALPARCSDQQQEKLPGSACQAEAGPSDRGCVCDAAERNVRTEGIHHGVESTDGVAVIAGSAGAQLSWLKLDNSGQMRVTRREGLSEEGVGEVCVRQDSRIVAVGCWDARVRVFHTRTGKRLAVLKQHRASITSVKFGESGLLACASRDRTVSIWDVFR